jgi:hypothetical protein
MASFARSRSGYRNSPRFHSGNILIWVEGADDVRFWRSVFPATWNSSATKIKPVGGGAALREIADDVRDAKTDAVVAMDSDYDCLSRHKQKHVRVVKTHGYSIENYIYEPYIVDEVLLLKCRSNPKKIPESRLHLGRVWEADLGGKLWDLIALDCAARNLNLSEEVMGNNSARFTQPRGWRLVRSRIAQCIRSMTSTNAGLRAEARKTGNLMKSKRLFLLIRGHFLEHSLYSLAIEARKRCGLAPHGLTKASITDCCFLVFEKTRTRHPYYVSLRRFARRALKTF